MYLLVHDVVIIKLKDITLFAFMQTRHLRQPALPVVVIVNGTPVRRSLACQPHPVTVGICIHPCLRELDTKIVQFLAVALRVRIRLDGDFSSSSTSFHEAFSIRANRYFPLNPQMYVTRSPVCRPTSSGFPKSSTSEHHVRETKVSPE